MQPPPHGRTYCGCNRQIRKIRPRESGRLQVSRDSFSFRSNGFRRTILCSVETAHRRYLAGARILSLRITRMQKTNSIIMHAPKVAIFETAANLELWPQILPHYRYIRYLERSPNRNVVVMAARRSGIPIKWTSEEIIDRDRVEIHFNHLKAFTKGMHVVWTFDERPDGVLVTILHDLNFRVKILAPIADKVIGDFFIGSVANKTLRCMKQYVEAQAHKVIA
jgi:ribosome-associated toxin RatA of RatAB toxin-antitoxin module